MSVSATDPQETICIVTPEDIVLAKQEGYRMGGEVSDRQWRDVLGVLKVRAGELDLDYLCRRAGELQVGDLKGCCRQTRNPRRGQNAQHRSTPSLNKLTAIIL